MEENITFKDPLGFWQDLFQESILLFYFFILFIFLSFLCLLGFIVTYHPVFILFLVGFLMMGGMVFVGFIINHYGGKGNIELQKETFTIPPFDFGNRALRGIDEEGYFYESEANLYYLRSSYTNIKRIWRVTNQSEKNMLKINKNWFNTRISINAPIINIHGDVKNIINIIKNYNENNKLYDNLIKTSFIYSYTTDNEKTVGIEFNQLNFRYPKMLKWIGKTPINSLNKAFYPNIKNPVIYLSVNEPEKLMEELNKRMKK